MAMSDEIDVRAIVYSQDCEFYRYQDRLMWSRFQTAATIEAGILYGLYRIPPLMSWEKVALSAMGLVLVFIICLLALKDQKDGVAHLLRMREFEKLGLPFQPARSLLKGLPLMWAIITVLTVVNLVVVIHEVVLYCSSPQVQGVSVFRM